MILRLIRNLIRFYFTKYSLSFYLLMPLAFTIILFNGLKFFFFYNYKKKIKNKKLNTKINFLEINSDLGKKHVNFRPESKKILTILLIASINKEIKIACKKYKLSFNKFNYNKIIKIYSYNASEKAIFNSYYFWLLKLFFIIPKSSCLIFYNFFGLTPNKKFIKIVNINNNKNSIDKKIFDYLFMLTIIKNLRDVNLPNNDLINFCKVFVNKYNDSYSLSLIEHFFQYRGSNANFLREISYLYLKKTGEYSYNRNFFLGSTLYAFGHMLSFIDFNYRIKSKNIKIVLSPNWVANSCLAYYLKFKYKNCIINDEFFIKCALNDKFQIESKNNLFAFKKSAHRISYNEYLKNKTVSPSIDLKILNLVLKNGNYKKINIEGKFICLFNRDNTFKNEVYKLNASDEDRSCDINIFIPVIKFFINKNFKIFIMSNPNQKKINFKHPSLIDYANSEYKNDFNDIILAKDCEFFLNGGASPNQFLPPLFRKFSLNLEYPFNRKPIFHDLAYYLPRPISKNNKILKFEDYFNDEIFSHEDFQVMKSLGYKLENNSKNTIMKAAKNFFKAYKGYKNLFKQKKIVKGNIRNYYNIFEV